VYALGERLKALTTSSQAFIKAAADMGHAADTLANDLLADWSAIEADQAEHGHDHDTKDSNKHDSKIDEKKKVS
jgi:hypothetical protein